MPKMKTSRTFDPGHISSVGNHAIMSEPSNYRIPESPDSQVITLGSTEGDLTNQGLGSVEAQCLCHSTSMSHAHPFALRTLDIGADAWAHWRPALPGGGRTC